LRRIRLIWVGRTKEAFVRDAVAKYEGLLRPYARIEKLELKEGRARDPEAVVRDESRRILERADRFVLLDAAGATLSSEEFAAWLDERSSSGPVCFLLGGAFGVSPEVRRRAVFRLSLSRMTLTHQIARIVLLEQIYRAFTILTGKTYHY